MTPNGTTWHALSVEEAIAELQTDRFGLSAQEAERRLETYGTNELGEEQVTSPATLILRQILNPLIYVLFAAAIVSFAVGHLVDGFVIIGIVVINTIIGFFQEYRAEKAMEALRQLAAPSATVLRDRKRVDVPAPQIIPGDIIVLATGDKVPADGRIIGSSNLNAEEASLTGESVPASKAPDPVDADTPLAERTNMVYAGTAVTYGRGEAVVVATGLATEVGKIAREVASVEREPTPLQQRLASVGRILALIALGLATLRFVTGLWQGIDFVEIFLFSVASAVAAIPEGLPAVVTIVLAIGLQRMAARNAIIRKLPAVETLGSATVICSDKTGTLTKNEMTVKALYTLDQEYEVTGEGYSPIGEIRADGIRVDPTQDVDLRLVLTAGTLCNDSEVRCENSHCSISGDPTEAALVTAAMKAGLTKSELARQMPRVDEIPFDSQRKYMVTLHDGADERLVFVKGAPEKLMAMCPYVRQSGKIIEFTDELKDRVGEVNHSLASRALRVLAFAYKESPKDQSGISIEGLEEGLVFLGLAGMIDPPRPEAIEAVRRSQEAGIRVMMATGDNKITAAAIASQMGILRDGPKRVVEGREVEHLTDDEMVGVVANTDVFARVDPEHKLRIVNALKRTGHVVAMTGDGVNDAPALKKADIGIAMGITGTDVAKEASEMVLTDDNFASIVGAVEEGRIVFKNIQKVVTYLLSTNGGEDLTLIAIIFAGLPLPLLPVQILWINLVTDSFPALSLAADPSEEDVLREPPRDPKDRIISRTVLLRLLLVATTMAAGTIGVFYWSLMADGIVKARTMAFATMAVFQFYNALNVRSARISAFAVGLFSNRWLVLAIVVGVGLQYVAINVPIMQRLFGTVPLSGFEWLVVALVSSTVLWVEEIRKLIVKWLGRNRAG